MRLNLYRAFLCLAMFPALFAVASSQTASPHSAKPIPSGARFTGPDGYFWNAQNASQPYSLILHDSVFRFEIHPEDHWPHDGAGSKKNRSEISGLTVPNQGKSTVSYEVMLVKGDFTPPHVDHVIGQRHGRRDPDDAPNEHPDVAFRILPGGLPGLTVAGSAENPLRTIPKSIDAWTGTANQFPLNVWHKLRIEVFAGADGWVDLWLDGQWMKAHAKDAHTYSGAFGYVNREDDYWKFGDYCPKGLTAAVIVEVRNIHRTID